MVDTFQCIRLVITIQSTQSGSNKYYGCIINALCQYILLYMHHLCIYVHMYIYIGLTEERFQESYPMNVRNYMLIVVVSYLE